MEEQRKILEQRTRRLLNLVEMSAPKQIISREVLLVIEAAMEFCPEIKNFYAKNDDSIKFQPME